MRKSNTQILKEMFAPLWLSVLFPAVIYLILMNLTIGPNYQALVEAAVTQDEAMIENIVRGFSPILFGVSGLIGLALLLFNEGVLLSIYRKVRYDTDIKFSDFFYFYNHKFLGNLGAVIVKNLIILLGFIVFIIPGLILTLGFYTFPIFLAENQDTSKGFLYPIKKSWEVTKGYKLSILGYSVLFGIIVSVIEWVLGLIPRAIGGNVMNAEPNPTGFGGLSIMTLIMTLINSLAGVIAYLAPITIFQKMLKEGAFPNQREELLDEDFEERNKFPRENNAVERSVEKEEKVATVEGSEAKSEEEGTITFETKGEGKMDENKRNEIENRDDLARVEESTASSNKSSPNDPLADMEEDKYPGKDGDQKRDDSGPNIIEEEVDITPKDKEDNIEPSLGGENARERE